MVLDLAKYKVVGQRPWRIHFNVDQSRAFDVIPCWELKGRRSFYCAVHFLQRQVILSRAASSSVVE